ncbi:hypothetical protein [Methylobacterium fujisawaense]|uniref:hypothetical protein n=1 Tax=Methylobacterium fujisawaense TaxID=107400 RepID=UPI002F35E2B0
MKSRLLRLLRPLRILLSRRLPGFDPVYYLYWYKDVEAAGDDPQRHYLNQGWREGRDPSAGFSTRGYLAANQDVAAAGINPLLHFVRTGLSEGRIGFEKDPKSTAPLPSEPSAPLWACPIRSIPSIEGLPPLQGSVDELTRDRVNGWAFGVACPDSPAEIEVYVDGCLLGTVIASTFRPDIGKTDRSNGHHGFTFYFMPPLRTSTDHKITVQRAVDKFVLTQVILRKAESPEAERTTCI